MIDTHPVDHTLAYELDHLGVRCPEDLPVLLLQATQLLDVEKAPVKAGAQVDVEEHLTQPEVAPERALVDGGHVVGNDVEDHAEPRSGELPELLLAAQRVG